MVDFSDEEAAAEPTAEEVEEARKEKELREAEAAKNRKAREDREENLRKMMEDDDGTIPALHGMTRSVG